MFNVAEGGCFTCCIHACHGKETPATKFSYFEKVNFFSFARTQMFVDVEIEVIRTGKQHEVYLFQQIKPFII